jgi:type I restriction enzyme S subunit
MITQLGNVVEIVGGGTPARDNPNFWDGGEIPWATVKDLKSTTLKGTLEHITQVGVESSSTRIIQPNSVIIATRMALGKAVINSVPLAINQDLKALTPASSLLPRYLLHYLLAKSNDFVKSGKGATVKGLTLDFVRQYPIPLPSLPEQQRIAAILDAADALREKRRQAIAKLDGLVQAVFGEMFGNFNPRRYQLEPLGACAHVVSGVTKGRQLNGRPTVELPYLRVANVQAGRLDLSEIKTITALPSDLDALRLQKGDVLLTEGGDYDKLGRGARWRGEIENCIHQNHIFRVRVDQEKLVPEFFEAYLQTPFTREYFLRCAKKTTNLASINSTQLRALPIHIPPIAIQERFRSVLYRIELLNEVAISSLAHLNTLFLSLQQRAFRGEL